MISIIIPNDFVLKGATPIHVYLDGNEITDACAIDGTFITVPNVAPNSTINIIIHLDYALKGNIYDTLDDFGMMGYTFSVNVQDPFGVQSSTTGLTTHQKKTTALSGFVTDSEGNPIAGITVELYDSEGNLMGTTISDENGFYYFIDIVAGNYELRITYDEELYCQFATALKNTLTQVDFQLITVV